MDVDVLQECVLDYPNGTAKKLFIKYHNFYITYLYR